MLGNFYPSIIKDQMYDFMSDYKIATDVYKYKLTDGIYPFLREKNIDFQLCCADWPNMTGGTCAIAWCENGHPQLVMFDYRY